MHTAAERARLRRQKEEEERTAAQERARQKAKELEARFGPAPSKSAAAQAAKPAPKEIAKKALPTKPSSSPAVPNTSTPVPPTGPSQSRPAKVLQAPQPIKPITSTPVLPPPAPRQQQKAALPRQVTLAAAPPSLKQLLEDGETGGDESHVNFADLGDLIAAEGSPQPAAAQPAAGSRRPAAADFFDRPPTSSGPVLPPPAEVATPRSPEVRAGALPQGKASVDNVLQRIKGVMHPDAPAAQQGAAPVRVVLPSPEPPYTYLPRPPSPSPVWKKFSVKINHDGRQRSPIPAKQLQVDPKRETLRAIDTLSWMPSMYKWLSPSTLSRDDWLLAPPFRKVLGRVAPPPAPVVSLPTKRISDLPVNPLPESPVFQRAVVKLPSAAAPALAVIPPTPARGGQFARSTLESTWRRAPQVGVADPSAAVGGPVNASAEAGAASDVSSLCPRSLPKTELTRPTLFAPAVALCRVAGSGDDWRAHHPPAHASGRQAVVVASAAPRVGRRLLPRPDAVHRRVVGRANGVARALHRLERAAGRARRRRCRVRRGRAVLPVADAAVEHGRRRQRRVCAGRGRSRLLPFIPPSREHQALTTFLRSSLRRPSS